MIGNPKWFKYRIFGWGVAPKTWQGWVYVAVAALVLGFTAAASINSGIKPYIVGTVFAVFILDILHIMMQLPKVSDERDNLHQLIIERNCSFAAIAALVGVALWQAYQNKALMATAGFSGMPFDASIAIVLGAMLFTKIASTAYVKVKM